MNDAHHPPNGETFRFTFLRYESVAVFLGAFLVSLTAFFYAYHHGWTNLYGDGVAHVAIARKVVDMDPSATLWEHYTQLGSPWLPLPHVLMLPFVWRDAWWRTGLAGSFVSMAAFVIGAVFLFRLSCLHYRRAESPPTTAERLAPFLALAFYLGNPTLLYLQTTPMTEACFLATLATSVYFLRLWTSDRRPRSLALAGICATLTTLTRYEGWALLPFTGLLVLWLSERRGWQRIIDGLLWGLLAAIGPLYWFWHNWAIYGRVTEFYSGVYSTSGYFLRHKDSLSLADFAVGHPVYAFLIVLLTVGTCVGPLTLLLGIGGIIKSKAKGKRQKAKGKSEESQDNSHNNRWRANAAVWLLFIPPLFTMYSVYSGNIQIYPFFLNVRYGLSALLPLALFAPNLMVWKRAAGGQRTPVLLFSAMLALIGLQSAYLMQEGFFQLSAFREGYRMPFLPNSREQRLLADYLQAHPLSGKVLMHTGELALVVADSPLTYSQVIHEGTRSWHQLPEKIPDSTEWIIYREQDELDYWLTKHPKGLEEFEPVWKVGQPALVLMTRKTFLNHR